MKLLVKTKRSVHIREKSEESAENLEIVHENKIKSWLALAEASHNAAGGTMEDVIQSVIDEMKGKSLKDNTKTKIVVTEDDYVHLLKQAYKKGIKKKELDELVVMQPEKPDLNEEALLLLHQSK